MGWKCPDCGDRGAGNHAMHCPSCGREAPTPADDNGFTAADWLALGTGYGNRMYERARKRIRFCSIDPEITLVFRGDDVIGRVWPVDRHAGGGFDLKLDRRPTIHGLDGWDRVRRVVESVTATDPCFA